MMTCLFGLLSIVIGIVWYWIFWRFFTKAVLIPGTIISFEKHERYERGRRYRYYTAVVAFEFDGQLRTIPSEYSSSSTPAVGQMCQVAVNPFNPQEARVYSRFPLFCTIAWIVVGILLVLFGLVEMHILI